MDNKVIIQELIEVLNKIKEENILVVVEGKKDVFALKNFGIKSIPLKGNLTEFCEKIQKSHKEVILLLDNDKEGKKLTSTLSKNFEILGVKTNKKYMFSFRKLGISHTEGILRFIKRKLKDFD